MDQAAHFDALVLGSGPGGDLLAWHLGRSGQLVAVERRNMGSGNFVAPKTLDVQLIDGGTRRLTGDKVFIDVGSHAAMPSVPARWSVTGSTGGRYEEYEAE